MASMESLVSLRSSLVADSEWLNIQNVIRDTFSMFYDVVWSQAATIHSLEERVSKMEENSREKDKDSANLKAELRRARQSIKDFRSEVTEELAGKLPAEEGTEMEERLNYQISRKADKDVLTSSLAQRPEQSSIEQMMAALRKEVDARVEPAERAVSRVGDLERTVESLRGQIDRTRSLTQSEVRDVETRMQSVVGTGSKETHQEMECIRRQMDEMNDAMKRVRESGVTHDMMEDGLGQVRKELEEVRGEVKEKASEEQVKRWMERKVDLKRINAWIQQHTSDLSSVLMGKASVSSVTELKETVATMKEEMTAMKEDVVEEVDRRCAPRRDVDDRVKEVMDKVCGLETTVKRKVNRDEFVAMLSEKVDHVEFVHRLEGDEKGAYNGNRAGGGSCGDGGGRVYSSMSNMGRDNYTTRSNNRDSHNHNHNHKHDYNYNGNNSNPSSDHFVHDGQGRMHRNGDGMY